MISTVLVYRPEFTSVCFGGLLKMDLIPGRLRKVRLSRLLTQVELARLAGTTQSTVNRIELGLQRPRISTVRRLAAALDVPASTLIEASNDPDVTGADDEVVQSQPCQ